ncbi:hypothetical protein Tco_1289501, partial [Tanacetum coccineum]
ALPANWSDIVKTLRKDKSLVVLSLEDLLQTLIVRYSIREHQQRQQMFDSSMPKRKRAP